MDLMLACSLFRSLQISFATPEPVEDAGKKGLIRRPKNYRGVDVKAFEGGVEQNLLQIKGCEFAGVLSCPGAPGSI